VSPQENRRRNRLVDRKFQFGLASRFLLVVAFFFFLGLVLVFAPSFYLLATTDDPKSLEAAATEFLVLHKRLWPAALICFAGVFLYALRLSHRMAGPVYRINTVLGQLLRDVPPGKITFRKNDFFLQTASLLNQLSEKLRNAPGNPRENAGNDPT
jgi:hypothetical protein